METETFQSTLPLKPDIFSSCVFVTDCRQQLFEEMTEIYMFVFQKLPSGVTMG